MWQEAWHCCVNPGSLETSQGTMWSVRGTLSRFSLRVSLVPSMLETDHSLEMDQIQQGPCLHGACHQAEDWQCWESEQRVCGCDQNRDREWGPTFTSLIFLSPSRKRWHFRRDRQVTWTGLSLPLGMSLPHRFLWTVSECGKCSGLCLDGSCIPQGLRSNQNQELFQERTALPDTPLSGGDR